MRFVSLFSGIGGFDLGLERAGLECAFQVERDTQCLKMLERHWPDMPRYTDVRDFNATTCSVRPELICGGFPCQDLSVAGRRAGLAGERSGLFFEFMRIVSDFAPRWVLIENVPGLLSSDEGQDMRAVVDALVELGYGWSYRVLDAQYFGVAQRRRRVFVVGCFADWRRAAEVLFERESLPWNPPPSREAGASVAGTLEAGAGIRRGCGINPGALTEVTHTLTGEGHDASEDGTGRGTPLVVSALDCKPYADHESKESRLVAVAFDETQVTSPGNYSAPKPGDPCHPLAAGARAPVIAFSSKDDGRDAANELAPTLRAMGHDASHASGGGQVAIAFQTRIARNGRGQPKDITDALTSCDGGTHADSKPHVAGSFGVRRLTPKECERLQGFPDEWTRYGADGKELRDSARYRMIGNAVAVPVIEWIGRRLILQHEKDSQC